MRQGRRGKRSTDALLRSVNDAQSTVTAVEMYEWLGQRLKAVLRAYVLTTLGQTTHRTAALMKQQW